MLQAESSPWNTPYQSHPQACPARRFFPMTSTLFSRLSGLALLVGGVVGAVEAIASAVLYPGHEATAQQILSFPWMLLASLYLAGFLLLALGLPGMYRHQSARTGGWGRSGFIVML